MMENLAALFFLDWKGETKSGEHISFQPIGSFFTEHTMLLQSGRSIRCMYLPFHGLQRKVLLAEATGTLGGMATPAPVSLFMINHDKKLRKIGVAVLQACLRQQKAILD